MAYFLSFIEGIITFISPCLLPMLPIYLSYFAGDHADEDRRRSHVLRNALGFVLGFTIVFVLLGAAAGTFGQLVRHHQAALHLVGGLFLVVVGLHFAGVLKLGFLARTYRLPLQIKSFRFVTSILFGFLFAIGWTPCVGAFLGAALMLAAHAQQAFQGIVMLLLYSMGLGIPFVLSALLIDSLKHTFTTIKQHYRQINLVCGLLLVLIGGLMASGRLGVFLSLLTFS